MFHITGERRYHTSAYCTKLPEGRCIRSVLPIRPNAFPIFDIIAYIGLSTLIGFLQNCVPLVVVWGTAAIITISIGVSC